MVLHTEKIASAVPAIGSATSARIPSRNAADPPIADQSTGTVERPRDCGVANINTPAVKIVVGHGRPNVGILRIYFSESFTGALDEHVKTEFPKLRDMLHRRG